MNGLLGQILGGMVAGQLGRRVGMGRRGRPGGNMIVNGILVALAAKAAQNYLRDRGRDRSFNPQQQPASPVPGGLGAMLGGLGGAGALGALLNQLRQRGLGEQVDSWVRPGPNRLVSPQELEQAIDDDDLEAMVEETGMPRQALLSELADTLPEAVDELTPDGAEPNDQDLGRIAGRA